MADPLRSPGRAPIACAIAGACGALFAPWLIRPAPRLVWNASPSVAVGLYHLSLATAVRRGDLVVVWLPDPARRLAASRRYLPPDVPLIKPVAAVAGDRVCALGAAITIAGRIEATRLARDKEGRSLPWWHGCRLLRGGELFLLGTARPDSFDSRYFGPVATTAVLGVARPLWVW